MKDGMSNNGDDRARENDPAKSGRRDFLGLGMGLAAASLLTRVTAGAQVGGPNTSAGRGETSPARDGRRRLGSLEVSSVGLGVQNMSRKYETTVPYRPYRPPLSTSC